MSLFLLKRITSCNSYSRLNILYKQHSPNRLLLFSSLKSNPIKKEELSNSTLIYKGSMKNSILALKIMTLNSSILSLVISPKLLEFCQDIPIALTALLGSVYSVFILNPFLIHILAKRYVLNSSPLSLKHAILP
ncbi:unnamed protein product [Gordionus sp. m RMFG-2023]